MTLEARFWVKVNKQGPVPSHRPDLGRCWIWTASISAGGYGRIGTGGKRGKIALAHQVSYEWEYGAVPPGLQLDHLCRVRNCVRPSHLEAVTARENLLRGATITAEQAARTHCPEGHIYAVLTNNGRRACRECPRERARLRPQNAIYKAERRRQIEAGTWNPRTYEKQRELGASKYFP